MSGGWRVEGRTHDGFSNHYDRDARPDRFNGWLSGTRRHFM
jgi:hypothetical protein